MTRWTVPPLWAGKTVTVLASGPSMSQSVADAVREAGVPTIVINTTFHLAPWADVLYAADGFWWAKYAREVESFAGLKVTCDDDFKLPGLLSLRNTGKVGFDDDKSCIRTGGNSGFQAIHVAVHGGARRVLLCGMDMHGGHWHGRHPEPLRNAGDGIFPRWLKHFDELGVHLRERGVSVVNCTPGSALHTWPHMALTDALECFCGVAVA
jgi:hypothetical protein